MHNQPPLPSVGVVIPVRDGAHLITETIESILWQTYGGPVSIVVVDDGSTDQVAELVRQRWSDIRVVSIPPSGLPVARNVGASELATDWLCFIDCDDLWHPQHLELLVGHALTVPEAKVLSSGVIRFSTKPISNPMTAKPLNVPGPARAAAVPPRVIPDTSRIRFLAVDRLADAPWTLEHPHFLLGNPIMSSNGLVDRRRFHATGGFPVALPAAEDYGFWLAASLLGPIHFTPDATMFYRVAESSMTTRTNLGLAHIAATLPFLVGVDLARNPDLVEKTLAVDESAVSTMWLASRSALARNRPLERRTVARLAPLLIPGRRRRVRFRLSAAVARARQALRRIRIRGS